MSRETQRRSTTPQWVRTERHYSQLVQNESLIHSNFQKYSISTSAIEKNIDLSSIFYIALQAAYRACGKLDRQCLPANSTAKGKNQITRPLPSPFQASARRSFARPAIPERHQKFQRPFPLRQGKENRETTSPVICSATHARVLLRQNK